VRALIAIDLVFFVDMSKKRSPQGFISTILSPRLPQGRGQ